MSGVNWIVALDPSINNAEAWAFVGKMAKGYLEAKVKPGEMISTATLVEALFPLGFAKQSEEGMNSRQRIVDALTNKYTGRYELAGCFTVAPPETKRVYGVRKTIKRRLWHPPVTEFVE